MGVEEQIQDLVLVRETDEEVATRLSKLDFMEYDRVREEEAKRLDVRVSTLDALVKNLRYEEQVSESIVEEIEPYPEPVSGVEVMGAIEATINRFMVLPSGASAALSAWIACTYVYDQFHIFPKLIIHSPQKRCGKSTALDIVEALSNKALFSSSISQAAIYRVIEGHRPTLIIDEADTFLAGRNDEIVGIINSGHAKNRAFVIRSDGDDHDPKRFSTWAPMAIAGIKKLQDTIMDRGIVIELRRKMVDEVRERMTGDLKQELKPLRQKLMRWGLDTATLIKKQQIEPPKLANDRAIDNWVSLFTVAHHIGGEWPRKVNNSYHILESKEEEPTTDIMLLEDIKLIFDQSFKDQMHSEDLVNHLIDLEERPWSEWKRGKPMTKNSLAKLLGAFGIKSQQFREGIKNAKGYKLEQFIDVFSRYLPETPFPNVTSLQPNEYGGLGVTFGDLSGKAKYIKETLQPSNDGGCNDVTFQKPLSEEEVTI